MRNVTIAEAQQQPTIFLSPIRHLQGKVSISVCGSGPLGLSIAK